MDKHETYPSGWTATGRDVPPIGGVIPSGPRHACRPASTHSLCGKPLAMVITVQFYDDGFACPACLELSGLQHLRER